MATKQKKGLGRGLESLLGLSDNMNQHAHDVEDNPAGKLQMLARDVIQAGKYQPRTHMDETALAELASSIATNGLMQPITVRPIGPERYEIIAGERRYRAAGIAGLSEVPVLIIEVDDKTALSLSLIENIQREDLNPLEEAQGLQRLISEFHYTHDSCASAIGRSRSAVSNLLRLLNLAPAVQTMLLAGDIDMGHARALLSLDSAQQVMLAQEINARRLSVRDTEKRVQAILKGEENSPKDKMRIVSGDIIRLEQQLSDALGAAVSLKMGKKNQGKMVIEFGNLDVLEGIMSKFQPAQ
ncbi:putative chromosome-partitioning protein ParB [Ephemeroptericola cinctiostellae]|uniref:Putative chromosome-partitioning protein ParB n=1 Tax=Ephemeroptericola cinctiostellae TaxID=2268024 RepID=A0A345D8L3_9BURK|nr:ParB/RepB/Spo0J family partition protein [Ephemeroptericola cinctiostellae]AXF84701.1 putative chromosome-partitioning protein ParB [Ephemeroptericola cinctiostellae]